MVRENLHATMLGFIAAVIVFTVLFYFVGANELIDWMMMTEPTYLTAILTITLVWLAAWGMSLETVLDVLGVNAPTARPFLIFTGATFLDSITPFGRTDDEPMTALFISWSTDTEYEAGLTAITSVDTISFILSVTIALIGAGYYTIEMTLGHDLETTLVTVIVLIVGTPAAVCTTWKCRRGLKHRLTDAPTPLIRTTTQYVPWVSVSTNDDIECRINGFSHSIERVSRNPQGLAVAFGLSGFGWFCQMTALWVVFYTIGAPIAFSIALFIVPIEAVAGVTPFPGGIGGIEWIPAILIAAASSAISFDVATAGIVVSRGFICWMPVVLGGLVMSTESAHGWRS